jgi:hypothetical protein
MTSDSRIHDVLRHLVDGHDLREELALQQVKAAQSTDWADFTVVALEDDLVARRPRHGRAQRIVVAVAVCALVAGAVALPIALRNRPRPSPPATAGQPVTTGYRSTVKVRIGPPPAQPSTATASTTTQPAGVTIGNPVRMALASGIRQIALHRSHLGPNEPGVDFRATTNATGDVLSLTAIAPTGSESTTLARNWATAFGTARRADARNQLLRQRHTVELHVTQLHEQLQHVDKQLETLAPATYKDLSQYDAAGTHSARATPPPPVPENGTPQVLNLAFERIQILSNLAQYGKSATVGRFEGFPLTPVAAQVLSQTAAVQIKSPHRSNTSTTWMAIGLLVAGLILATSAVLLRRRTRADRVG